MRVFGKLPVVGQPSVCCCSCLHCSGHINPVLTVCSSCFKKHTHTHTQHLPVVSVASGSFTLLYFQHRWPMITLFTACINMRLDKHIFLSRANKMLYHRAFSTRRSRPPSPPPPLPLARISPHR